jgi:hypothetical protein
LARSALSLLGRIWFDFIKMLGNMSLAAQDVVLMTIHVYI